MCAGGGDFCQRESAEFFGNNLRAVDGSAIA
jgi:hypothetical protein